MELREKGKQRRKQRILDAARQLLQQGGRAALSTSQLAQQAEVSVATLYNLIGSVDQIVDMLVADISTAFAAQVRESVQSSNPAERLQQYLDASFDFFTHDTEARKATLRTVIESNINQGWSPLTLMTADQQKNTLLNIVRDMQSRGYLQAEMDSNLLTDQLQVTLGAYIQHLVTGSYSPQQARIHCQYHCALLLAAFASETFAQRLAQRSGALLLAIQGQE